MSYVVAPGREVSINGRRYLGGDTLPDMNGIAIEALLEHGVVKAAAAGKVEPPKQERRK